MGQNICGPFYMLIPFSLTTTETELEHYHQKMNKRVAPRVSKQLRIDKLIKLVNLNKIPKMLGIDFENSASHRKSNFDICAKKWPKISCRTFHRKTYSTQFANFCAIGFAWFFEERYSHF